MINLELYEKVKVPCIGKKYHVTWAHNGVVGVCYQINGDYVHLLTPKTRIPFKNSVHVDQLRHLKHRSRRLQRSLNKGGTTEEQENDNVHDCSHSLWKKISKNI